MFSKYTEMAEVFEQKKITDNGYTKTEFFSKYVFVKGNLKAQNIETGIDLDSFGKIYKFICDGVAKIEEGNRLKINGEFYDVKGIASFYGKTYNKLDIILFKK